MIKTIELISFIISTLAFVYGLINLFHHNTPKYFQMYIFATGSYMLEELWVIVNALFGNGNQDGLLTVRLFGLFGCFCFILSSNINELNKTKNNIKLIIVPLIFLIIYSLYVFSPNNISSPFSKLVGFISISPALCSLYLSAKTILLNTKVSPIIKEIKEINIVTIIFLAANIIYPLVDLYLPKILMSIYDLFFSFLLFIMILLCKKGANKWKTLI